MISGEMTAYSEYSDGIISIQNFSRNATRKNTLTTPILTAKE